jgi:hypothetical protein
MNLAILSVIAGADAGKTWARSSHRVGRRLRGRRQAGIGTWSCRRLGVLPRRCIRAGRFTMAQLSASGSHARAGSSGKRPGTVAARPKPSPAGLFPRPHARAPRGRFALK